LEWTATDLHRNSTEYPHEFKEGISRSYAFRLLLEPTSDDRREVTRAMCNLLAHELAAYYEKQDERLDADQKTGISRKSVEFILNDLLRAAGFAPARWLRDRWDAIIGNPDAGEIRVGYFPWPGFADADFSEASKSFQCVKQLLRSLSISASLKPTRLNLADLYDRYLFERVDLIAPLVGVPSRRFNIAYSAPIHGWAVGQTVVVHEKFLGPNKFVPDLLAGAAELRNAPFIFHFVKGGVSELLIELLGLKPSNVREASSFDEAVEAVLVQPEIDAGRCPVFVGDAVTCEHTVEINRQARKLLKAPCFARALVFGLPT